MNVKRQKTKIASGAMLTPQWWLVDAKDQVVGRLASRLVSYLQGKHKPWYTPHLNCGDKLVITNVDKVRFTGKKFKEKQYTSYSGYPGGQKVTTPERLHKRGLSERILRHAVHGMLPKNRLRALFMANCYFYTGEEHPHTAQNPAELRFS